MNTLKMKRILILFFLTCAVSFSQDEYSHSKVHWIQGIEKAKSEAKSNKKSILMYFTGSDWCMPCIMLKEDFFDSDRFDKYHDSYVFLKVDIPRNKDLLTEEQLQHNYTLLEKYNKNKVFPLVTVLSPKGKVLDQISGYSSLRDPKYYFELLDKFK